MSTSNFDETYMGRDILVSYLQQHQDKSYFGFLSCSRDTIVTSSMLFSASWINLDSSWLSRFLDEAKRLNQDNFTALNEKGLSWKITGFDRLVTTPGPLFGHPFFVVSKGISVLEDE
ncbi:22483_t:CDS:2, partial [Rhizophagus irregularis]